MKYIENLIIILAGIFLFSACSNNDDTDTNAPIAKFSVVADKLTVKLVNESENADSYYWDMGNGVITGSTSPQYTFLKSGAYQITLTAANKNGLYDRTSTIVALTDSEIGLEAIFVYEAQNDFTYQFTNKSVGAVSYKWDFGDGETSVEESPIHTFAGYGKFQVKLEVANANGDIRSSQQEVFIRKQLAKIDIDGEFSDWDKVDCIYSDPNPVDLGLRSVKIAHSDAYIYMMIVTKGNASTSPLALFIDRDCNERTGWLDFWGSPADFTAEGTLFNNGIMWSNVYNGADLSSVWSWTGIDPITVVRLPDGGCKDIGNGNYGIEIAIDRTTIPNCPTENLDFALKIRSAAWVDVNALPALKSGSKMLRYTFDEMTLKIIP